MVVQPKDILRKHWEIYFYSNKCSVPEEFKKEFLDTMVGDLSNNCNPIIDAMIEFASMTNNKK